LLETDTRSPFPKLTDEETTMKAAPVFAALALIAGTPLAAQMSPMPMDAAMAPTTTAAAPFLMMAAESDIFEITSSQIAVMRSQNPAVRAYASMLIDHHTQTTNVALTQAKAAGITPPPAILQAEKRAMITQLLAASAADFDRMYLTQQVPAHEAALALHTTYARNGDTPQLRTAAVGAVPFVTRHLGEARRMLATM